VLDTFIVTLQHGIALTWLRNA